MIESEPVPLTVKTLGALHMNLPLKDARSVEACRKLATCWEKGLILDAEVFPRVMSYLDGCTDDGVQQCIAVLPYRLGPQLLRQIDEVRSQPHPGKYSVYAPMFPREQHDLDTLDSRAKRTLRIVEDYLRSPTGPVAFEVDHDSHHRAILEEVWETCQKFETVPGEMCRREKCHEDRIQYAVFCRAHHFEAMYGELPPCE